MSELLNPLETAEFLHVRPQTLATWRLYGRGPDFIKCGRLVRYSREALVRGVEAQTVSVGEG